jgi:hypothetical protein
VVKNQSTMREYSLQRVVQAAQRGTFIVDDKYHTLQQHRRMGNQYSLAVQGHGKCGGVQLVRWKEDQQQFTCSRCKERSRRGEEDMYRSWYCQSHDVDFCMTCTPVVLRTPEW